MRNHQPSKAIPYTVDAAASLYGQFVAIQVAIRALIASHPDAQAYRNELVELRDCATALLLAEPHTDVALEVFEAVLDTLDFGGAPTGRQ